MDKLAIGHEMKMFDEKNRSFYAEFTAEEKKKFSPYLMIRWGSSVQASTEVQEYYILSTHAHLNKNFFALSKHPEMQWLTATTVSPGIGVFRHQWIALKKKEGSSNKAVKFLSKLYPTYKISDIELMARLTDPKELKTLAEEHGWTKEQIKKDL